MRRKRQPPTRRADPVLVEYLLRALLEADAELVATAAEIRVTKVVYEVAKRQREATAWGIRELGYDPEQPPLRENQTMTSTVTDQQNHRCAEGWVCEMHPDREWPHPKLRPEDGKGADCAGPGMPCQFPGCEFVAAWTKGREQ